MIPESVKKVLVNYWGYKEEDLKEDLLEKNHYIVWFCGIDHIVDRTKTPDGIIIKRNFKLVNFNFDYKQKDDVVIFLEKGIRFFYYETKKFIEAYYGNQPFEVRAIAIPSGQCYLEFKLDDTYSYVYQQLYELDEEEKEDAKKILGAEINEPKNLSFDEVFIKINITSDMVL